MLWFRYRWVLTFSHGLCVKIIRGSDEIKNLDLELRRLDGMPMNLAVGKGILDRLLRLISILDDVIFSTSALLYREEKDLIRFSKRVEEAAERLIVKLRKKKGIHGKDAKKLESMMKELKEKKQKLPKRLQRSIKKENEIIAEDEEKKKNYVGLLHELTSFIEEIDNKIHNIHLESKAQIRRTLNTHRIKENVIIRSNFRLGELTGRRSIEAGTLIKRIRKKLHHFSRIVGGKKKLNIGQVKDLLKYCRMEANDLENVFLFIVQLGERVEERLKKLSLIISKNPKLRSLTTEYFTARKRLNELRRDIQTQHRRLDNEFKKGGFMPAAQIQKELKAA